MAVALANGEIFDKETLSELYINEGMSTREIAECYLSFDNTYSHKKVLRLLKERRNIMCEMSPIKQTQRIILW